jgi:predicted permease
LLQRDARSLGGRAGQLGKALIVGQIALSLMLLLAAGLFVRSLEELHSVRLGFNKSALLEISLSPKPGGYDNLDMPSYHKQLLERIAAISEVSTVGYADFSIPSTDVWHDTVSEASADPNSGLNLIADGATVSPGFFRMLGIPLLGGRDFSETEDGKHPRVAVVSGGLARRLFPKGDAIGKRIRFGVMPEHQSIEIIGIADDARIFDLREAAAPAVYLSSWQYPGEWGELFVRASGVPEALARIVDHEIESLGHEYALRTQTIEEVTSEALVEERVTAMLSGFFAALALLLASLGLYGLMSYRVTQRTREIGIRVALGAQRESILWTVLRETLGLVLCGLALGIPCALAASRLIASMLFGLSPSDLPTITGVSLSLLLVALFAGYLPARRASGIDPMIALRHE